MPVNRHQKVGIFPAAGGIGGGTVKHILKRLSPEDLILIARHPEKLAAAKDLGAEVRQADFDDDTAIQTSFRGIDILFLISYASVEHEYRTERHKVAVDAAIENGVKYIFYGSLGFAGSSDNKTSVAHVMQPHLDTEKYLEDCRKAHPGFDYTIIREGLYTESYPLYTAFFDPTNPSREIKIPHDGSSPGVAWVKREELGEGTAELISRFVRKPEEFPYRGKTVRLTGNKTLSLSETVKILGEIANAPVRISEVSVDEFAALSPVPPGFTYRGFDFKVWATAFEAFRRGEAANVSPLLEELLGREPEDFKTTVQSSI